MSVLPLSGLEPVVGVGRWARYLAFVDPPDRFLVSPHPFKSFPSEHRGFWEQTTSFDSLAFDTVAIMSSLTYNGTEGKADDGYSAGVHDLNLFYDVSGQYYLL